MKVSSEHSSCTAAAIYLMYLKIFSVLITESLQILYLIPLHIYIYKHYLYIYIIFVAYGSYVVFKFNQMYIVLVHIMITYQ